MADKEQCKFSIAHREFSGRNLFLGNRFSDQGSKVTSTCKDIKVTLQDEFVYVCYNEMTDNFCAIYSF